MSKIVKLISAAHLYTGIDMAYHITTIWFDRGRSYFTVNSKGVEYHEPIYWGGWSKFSETSYYDSENLVFILIILGWWVHTIISLHRFTNIKIN